MGVMYRERRPGQARRCELDLRCEQRQMTKIETRRCTESDTLAIGFEASGELLEAPEESTLSYGFESREE